MSRTRGHKIEGKFRSGVIDFKDVPLSVKCKWNRHNFEGGRFKKDRLNRIKQESEISDLLETDLYKEL